MLRELLLEKKRDVEQEYTLHLFEFCNLSCSFCWQDHANIIGIDSILEKLIPIEKLLSQETKQSVVFNIMGGEIFADEIFNEKLLTDYKNLATGIKNLCSKHNKKLKINWVTNLVTKKYEQLDELLQFCSDEKLEFNIVTSYDPRGRFNKEQFLLFKENLYRYKMQNGGVGILLTKQNIFHWLTGKDNFLRQIYDDGFYIYADYYMPDEMATFQAPTDTDLLKVFKLFIKSFPKIHPIADWLKNDKNFMSCRTSKLVLQDGTICLCGNLVQDEKIITLYKSKIETNSNKNIENSFLEKYDCVSCEYFDRCTMGCFMQHDYKFREELEECVYKLTHKYIEDENLRIN